MNNQKNLDWIQMLRGIAALLVVLCHARYALLNTEGFGLAQQLLMPGASGVDLFFLISGFIMCYSTAGSDGSPAEVARFAIKRFARVWPVYAVVTLVAIFALSGGVEYFHDPAKRATFWHSIAMVPANPRYMPYFSLSLEQGWTLLFEMYFYLMFVVSMLFRRLRWVALAAWVGLTVIAPQLGAYDMSISRDFGYSVGYLSIVTSPFVLEFVAGVLIGWLYLQPWFRIGNRQLAWHGLGLGVAFALWAIYSGATVIHGPTQWGWPLALMVTLMALASKTVRIPVPPFFLWLGAISYSLYLTHLIAQGLVRRAMEAYGLGHLSHTWGFIFISTACALPLAALSHRLLEQGLSNLVRNALLRLVPAKPQQQPQQPVQAAAPTIAHLSR
jgi:peptidoglycan/LPS O-acetylase OafA/YrhL